MATQRTTKRPDIKPVDADTDMSVDAAKTDRRRATLDNQKAEGLNQNIGDQAESLDSDLSINKSTGDKF